MTVSMVPGVPGPAVFALDANGRCYEHTYQIRGSLWLPPIAVAAPQPGALTAVPDRPIQGNTFLASAASPAVTLYPVTVPAWTESLE